MAAMAAQQPPLIGPRSKSVLSFGSYKSSGSTGKVDLTETRKEKLARKMTTKADPTKAMTEAQPGVQAYDHTTLEPLRSLQHRDIHGNLITDPDRSNPTRPRLERPLDTIRSFEAAIDGSYRKRMSTRLVNSDPSFAPSRRSSYYQGASSRHGPQPRFQADGNGYLGNRYPQRRPDSFAEDTSPSPPHAGYGRAPPPRNYSDPALYGRNQVGESSVYPTHAYQHSYDTATNGSVSGSQMTDQWGNSTNPSSENSSIDKVNLPKQDSVESYGNSGFGVGPQFQGPILEEARQEGPQYGQPGYGRSRKHANGLGYQGNVTAPAAPKHMMAKEYQVSQPAKAIISLSSAHHNASQQIDSTEKRKSWLMRRFSKKG